MKKIILLFLMSSFLSIWFSDNHFPEAFTMEALQCKFTKGNDMDSAKRVIAQWKDNADKNFSAPYSAWVITPLYTSNQDVEFDKLTIIANELDRYKKEYGLIDFNDMILDFVKSDKSPKFEARASSWIPVASPPSVGSCIECI